MSDRPTSLADFVGPSRESGDQLCFQHCPVCGCSRWKTYVNPATGMWWCHAPEHSGGGRVEAGMSTNQRCNQVIQALTDKPHDHVWEEIALPAWTPLSGRAVRYLSRRGIDATRAAELGMVEMEDSMRVVVPFVGRDGRINYWSARKYSELEDGPKYLGASGKHPLYVRPGWTPTDVLVLVEGVFDAIAVEAHTGLHVAALGGKALPRYLEPDVLRLGVRELVVLLDSDALGAAIKLRQRLVTRRQVRLVPLPAGEDPASLGPRLKEFL